MRYDEVLVFGERRRGIVLSLEINGHLIVYFVLWEKKRLQVNVALLG